LSSFRATIENLILPPLTIFLERFQEVPDPVMAYLFLPMIRATDLAGLSVLAVNEDNRSGAVKTASVAVFKDRYRLLKTGSIRDMITGETKTRFQNNGNGTVTDLLTNLMWLQQPKQIALTWENAVEYCRNLEFESQTGWRLPTINEFKKLSDKKQQNPALPDGHPFTNVLTHVGYWSKTKHKFGPQYVYQMSMWYGKANHMKKSDNAIVWPVRYAE